MRIIETAAKDDIEAVKTSSTLLTRLQLLRISRMHQRFTRVSRIGLNRLSMGKNPNKSGINRASYNTGSSSQGSFSTFMAWFGYVNVSPVAMHHVF